MSGEEIRQVALALTGLRIAVESYCEVMAHHDVTPEGASAHDEIFEVRIQLRSAAGQIQVTDFGVIVEYLETAIDRLPVHLFSSSR
jgi:hypothetical protein